MPPTMGRTHVAPDQRFRGASPQEALAVGGRRGCHAEWHGLVLQAVAVAEDRIVITTTRNTRAGHSLKHG